MEKTELEKAVESAMISGRQLSQKYFSKEENKNKLKAVILQLSNTLRTKNVTEFMDIVTRLYGSFGEQITCAKAFAKMMTNKEYFREIGYAYIIGLEGSNKEVVKNEE